MTLQTNLLDTRLAQAVAKAQQAAAAGPATDNNDGRVAFDLPAGLTAELRWALRQFGLLQRERSTIESAIATAPAEQRRQAQAHLASFDADLARLLGRAARLAFVLLALRQREAAASSDAAAGVQHLGTVFGRTLDTARVRQTVQQLSTRPMGAAEAVEAGALVDSLFIALALVLVIALAPRDAVAA